MAKVELKQPIVDEIKAKIDGAATVVLVDYRGLTVEQDTKLRKGLREAGCEYKVYKNTFMKRAFEGTDFAQLDDLLDGPSAIAISKEDATAPIRVLNNVAKENSRELSLREHSMMLTVLSHWQAFHQETSLFPSCLVLCSHLLPILLVCLIRSQSRARVQQRLKFY